MKRRHNADPWAGGNHAAGTHHGKHGTSPGWKAGRHWVECQRCGLDYLDSDIKPEWTGAIVCKSCWEPRHPQDFTRSYPEKIAPPSGLVTGGALGVGGPAADGGTECVPSTFISGDITDPTVELADLSNEVDDVVTAVETQDSFPTWVDPTCGTITPSNYSLAVAPGGAIINYLTGIITGTLTETADESSPYSTVVTAHYASPPINKISTFTWSVADPGVDPDATTGSSRGIWWDFSEDEYLSQDTSGLINVVDGSTLEEVQNRFNLAAENENGNPLADETRAPTWSANVKNGLGALNAALDGSNTRHLENAQAGNRSGSAFQPWEVFVVMQIPDPVAELQQGMFSGTNQRGHQCSIQADELVQSFQVTTTYNDEIFPDFNDGTTLDPDWTDLNRPGQWHAIYLKFHDNTCDYQTNTEGVQPPVAEIGEHDANMDEVKNSTMPGLRVGCKVATGGGSSNAILGWGGLIGEIIVYGNSVSHENEGALSSAEVTGILTYLVRKWDLTDEVY